MVRTVLANRVIEEYLMKISEEKTFSYGIIIGQPSSAHKYYVIYLAKTLELPYSLEFDEKSSITSNIDRTGNQNFLESLENFDGHNLVNHSVSLTRMIPGSFYVLGVFVITENNIFENTKIVNKFKTLFRDINRALSIHKHVCGRPPNQQGNLLLNYLWSKTFECKLFDLSGENVKSVDWKFIDKPTAWHMFETSYELDDIFPVKEKQNCLNLESNFNESLTYISTYIENSTIFIENDNIDEEQILETYIKEKQLKKELNESFKAFVLDLTSVENFSSPKLVEFHGTIRYIGTIYSRVWVHPKCSFKDIKKFIRNDIKRSLASRIQIFCDGLSNTNASNDAVVVNIPPKRVFFDILDGSGIQFSEYIFNGENAQTVLQQAKELLDLDIEEKSVFLEFEKLPSYDDSVPVLEPTSSSLSTQTIEIEENKKLIFYGGIIIAIGILIFSILLHFIFR